MQTFAQRMAGFPVTVKGLSRFTDPAESRKVLEGMADGSVDIVIGTHRLLQTGVTWKDLAWSSSTRNSGSASSTRNTSRPCAPTSTY